MVEQAGPLRVFVSYSHKDEEFRNALHDHLAMLIDTGAITTWFDGMILPGDEWAPEVFQEIEQADIIILLISANYLSSKFCRSIEMTRALERHEAREARVIPVLIKPCDWALAPFARLKGLPKDMKAVTSWDDPDAAWTDVAIGIREAVMFERTNRTTGPPVASAEAPRAQAASMSMRMSEPIVLEGLRTFQLEVRAETIPEQGYLGFQTVLHHGSLVYKMRDNQDEFVWPAANLAVALKASFPQEGAKTWVLHGVLSGLLPPLPQSHHIGPLLRVMLQCPHVQLTEAHSHKVYLIPHSKTNTNGAGFMNKDEVTPAQEIGSMLLPEFGTTAIAGEIDVVCNPSAE